MALAQYHRMESTLRKTPYLTMEYERVLLEYITLDHMEETDIVKIILRWRCYQFVFTGNIEKMYRQIIVQKPDRAYQRILFRPNSDEAIKTFELKTVTFGINCAPFLAIRTLKQLGSDCEISSQKAADLLNNEIYVDDVLSGGYRLEEAKEKQA
ncbi:uncharacterized protein LOC142235422 [Haematobia irritans]|uniref:uncharacterized protein LOC142235422 n=1 Tax=Haematobia irritans TaxID=7368 RepID=UPI003F500BF0